MQRSTIGNNVVISPAGPLTFENADELEKAVSEAAADASEVVLDCKSVTLMDSEALERIVKLHQAIENDGRALKIANLNEVCASIFAATRLINILRVYDELTAALGGKGRP